MTRANLDMLMKVYTLKKNRQIAEYEKILKEKQNLLIKEDKTLKIKEIVEAWEAEQSCHNILSVFHVTENKTFYRTCENLRRFLKGTLYSPSVIGIPKHSIIPKYLEGHTFPKFTVTDFKSVLTTFLSNPTILKKINLNEFLTGNIYSKSSSIFLAVKYDMDNIPKNTIPLCSDWINYIKMWWGETTHKQITTKKDIKNVIEYLNFHIEFFKDYKKPGMPIFTSDPYKVLPQCRFALYDITAPAIAQKWKPDTITTGLLRQSWFHVHIEEYVRKQGIYTNNG